jgi:hypothetical protein
VDRLEGNWNNGELKVLSNLNPICPKCGLEEHIHTCPKPKNISKEDWIKMGEDERYNKHAAADRERLIIAGRKIGHFLMILEYTVEEKEEAEIIMAYINLLTAAEGDDAEEFETALDEVERLEGEE